MDFKYLKGDIFGGITAGVVALPLALAFGVQSGLGAITGLYGAIAIGIFASLFGGTPTQVSGPTGPMTVVSTVVIAAAMAASETREEAIMLITLTFFMAGLFQIILGFVGIGRYIKYIPYPVLSGFMTGIGVIIIILQVFPLLGHVSPKTVVDTVMSLTDPIMNMNFSSFGLGLCTIAIIYLSPYVTKVIPSTLLALLIVTALSVFMDVDIARIGEIPKGLPDINIGFLKYFDLTHIQMVLVPSLTLAALGALDSLLTSVVADNITKTKHNSNRELLGQGIGNMIVALIGGLPGAGATMRTVVNINSGGRTRLAGIIHGLFLLMILLGLGSFAEYIPLPVLAGILITVGISIIDYKGIRHIIHIPRTDAVVMIIVLLLTVFVDLLQAVGVGMVLASVLFMKKMGDINEAKTELIEYGEYDKEKPWADEKTLSNEFHKQVYIKHLSGPIFFGFASQLLDIVRSMPQMKAVVIRMERVPYIDQSGLYAIEDAVIDLTKKGVIVALSGVQGQVYDMIKQVQIIPELIPEDDVFTNFDECHTWLARKFENKKV